MNLESCSKVCDCDKLHCVLWTKYDLVYCSFEVQKSHFLGSSIGLETLWSKVLRVGCVISKENMNVHTESSWWLKSWCSIQWSGSTNTFSVIRDFYIFKVYQIFHQHVALFSLLDVCTELKIRLTVSVMSINTYLLAVGFSKNLGLFVTCVVNVNTSHKFIK